MNWILIIWWSATITSAGEYPSSATCFAAAAEIGRMANNATSRLEYICLNASDPKATP